MAVTIRQDEGVPGAWPALGGLSGRAAALDPATIWQRLESYCAWRWSPREVTWIAQGEGLWTPPLRPCVIDSLELWEDCAWREATPLPHPLGIVLPIEGEWRVTAIVGADDEPPAVVLEAARRLAHYMAETDERPGAARYSYELGGLQEEYERAPTWLARALQYSGAADLLRPYRRAA